MGYASQNKCVTRSAAPAGRPEDGWDDRVFSNSQSLALPVIFLLSLLGGRRAEQPKLTI